MVCFSHTEKNINHTRMEIAKEKSVSFTGYRTSKILKSSSIPNLLEHIKGDIYTAVSQLCSEGYNTFITGMSEGFDLIAAIAVLEFKKTHSDINLIAVIPFEGQDWGYGTEDKDMYKYICDNVDSMVLTSQRYSKDAFFKRNDYLLDNSSAVVCYYDGQRGGTMYTYNRAKKRELPIINIFDKYDV